MKFTKNILYLSILLLLVSCTKKEDDYDEYTEFRNSRLGETHALKNGEEWTATHSYYKLYESGNFINLYFYKTNDYNELRDQVMFMKIPLKPGVYKVNKYPISGEEGYPPSAVYFSKIADGDAIENYYELVDDGSFDNMFTIHEIKDKGDKSIIGEFQVKFLVFEDNLNISGNPDTIIFEKAEFETVLLDR